MELGRPLSTITPTLDGDVLAVLARSNATFTTAQIHQILGSHSLQGVRKVLRRLSEQGVVQEDSVGNVLAYQLNRDHLAAEYIMGLTRMWETLLKRLEDRFASWNPQPVYAAVFGSAARGSMRPDSDLDLFLVRPDDVEDDVWEDQIADLVIDVSSWTGNDTRPLVFTASRVATHGSREPVLRDVLNEGVTVAGSRAWLSRQLRKR
jgi:hypothetical protein